MESIKIGEEDLFYIPAVKKIAISDIGPFGEIEIEFIDSMNILCGPRGSGKTALVKILKGIIQNWIPAEYLVGKDAPDAFAVLASSELKMALKKKQFHVRFNDENTGLEDKMFEMLSEFLTNTTADYCVVMDGILCWLFSSKRKEDTLRLLYEAPCQKIIAAPAGTLIKGNGARIIELFQEKNLTQVRIVE